MTTARPIACRGGSPTGRGRAQRRASVVGLLLVGLGTVLISWAAPALAHPLGNVTINHYDGLTLSPGRVTDLAVEDTAEIPTLQRRSRIDIDNDGTVEPAEATRYAAGQCAAMAAAVRLDLVTRRLALRVTESAYRQQPGAAGLPTGRLTCRLIADADLRAGRALAVRSDWDSQGIGWHEITARPRDDLALDSPFPVDSISRELTAYPNDLLTSPLDVRGGTITASSTGTSSYRNPGAPSKAGPWGAATAHVATVVDDLVGRRHLSAGVLALAALLAALLGAGHALLPGHGKTIMAAYLVGRQGRLRDVVAVGATVTLTHTLGVLLLAGVLSATSAFAPAAAVQVLAVASGLLVLAVGAGLLQAALRRRTQPHLIVIGPVTRENVPAFSGAGPGPVPAAQHDHDHGAAPGHHQHGPAGHTHEVPAGPFGLAGLIGLGVAGGLVPSPSALLVLLAAAAFGRTAFGIGLVLSYGLGMAAALTAAGLLLVHLRDRLTRSVMGRHLASYRRVAGHLPVVTAGLVVLVGAGLTVRALSGAV